MGKTETTQAELRRAHVQDTGEQRLCTGALFPTSLPTVTQQRAHRWSAHASSDAGADGGAGSSGLRAADD